MAVKVAMLQRIDGIGRKNAEDILSLVDRERYTKFDDWPPFERQGKEALNTEAEAFKVLKEYRYETSDWRIDLLENVALASFMIQYQGTIRNRRFDMRSRVTAVFVKRDGEWKLLHEHWSSLPEGGWRRESKRRWLPI
jgi:ketosteroid isomerase-like protein